MVGGQYVSSILLENMLEENAEHFKILVPDREHVRTGPANVLGDRCLGRFAPFSRSETGFLKPPKSS